MVLKIILYIYRFTVNVQTKLKLKNYKYLWKNQFFYSPNFKIDNSFNLQIQSGDVRIIFHDGVHFRNFCSVICSGTGKLTLGKNVTFNNNCSINCLFEVTIDDNTIFGEGVRLYDHNHRYGEKGKTINEQGMKFGAIKIGSNCWIGSNTVILPNVEIGSNVIIGANNLIHKSVPSNTVVIAESEKIYKTI